RDGFPVGKSIARSQRKASACLLPNLSRFGEEGDISPTARATEGLMPGLDPLGGILLLSCAVLWSGHLYSVASVGGEQCLTAFSTRKAYQRKRSCLCQGLTLSLFSCS